MEITAAMVKELRERTQAGMMDCKKALVETNGDMEKAIEYLREKGLAANAKKAGRVAAEGMVDSHIHTDGKVGVLVEVNCETDFVANTDSFRSLCHDLALQIASANPKYVSKEDAPSAKAGNEAFLLEQPFVKNPDITVQTLVNETALASGEKISVRRFTRYEGDVGLVDSYIHMGGKIGVLVEVNCETEAVAGSDSFRGLCHDLALQIAASNPLFVRKEDVPTENLNKEREILRVQALNEGKPEKIVDRMVEGRIEKYYKEVCLLEQPFVKDPDITVQTLVNEAAKASGEQITVRRFTRYERGEGIEKKVSDLAGEIEAMTAKQ